MIKKITKKILLCFLLFTLIPAIPFAQPTEDEIQESINNGLEFLVAQQNTNGSWTAYYSNEAGTGLALYKLCERAYELGFESPFDNAYIYHQNVIDGFDWLFMNLTVQTIGLQNHLTGASGAMDDPDVNGNGTGVCSAYGTSRETYYTGILLTAIAASGTPDRVVATVGSAVNGNTFLQVAQDMVDFLAWGQLEYPASPAVITREGGWSYSHVDNGIIPNHTYIGDQSNSGYAVLGLSVAQDFGAVIPDWVKTSLNVWIDWVQDDVDDPVQTNDGGSWYSYTGDPIGVNTLKTGNLLSEMALCGDAPETPRVQDAIDYLARHWADASGVNNPPGWDGDPAQYQAMFCLMKGLVFIGIDEIDGTDWFEDFATVILAQQYLPDPPDANYGAWLSSSGRSEKVMNTLWALLTLEKIAPNIPPEAICKDLTLVADEDCLANATAEDVDDGSNDPNEDEITLELLPEGPYPLGETEVTLIVTDDHGNADECTAIITVVDVTPPKLECPKDVTLECPAETDPWATGKALAEDNCDDDVLITYNDVVVAGCGYTEVITRTWIAEDNFDNKVACVQTITVVDNTPPVAICNDIEVFLDDEGEVSITVSDIDGGSYDKCGEVEVEINKTDFTCDDIGDNFVILTVTDECDNVSTCEATVTVIDAIPPILTVIAEPIVIGPSNHKYISFNVDEFVTEIWDNCSELSADDVKITRVTSDEEENAVGNGDGDTVDDMIVSNYCQTVSVRKERDGGGTGRVYTIFMNVTDESGNVSEEAKVLVYVPHDTGDIPVNEGPAYEVIADCDIGDIVIPKKSGILSADPMGIDRNELSVKFYPNPTTGRIIFEIGNYNNPNVRVSVTNIVGQKVFEHAYHIEGQIELDLSANTSGVYFVNLVIDENRIMRKVSLIGQ